jgi:hypothetical protein
VHGVEAAPDSERPCRAEGELGQPVQQLVLAHTEM